MPWTAKVNSWCSLYFDLLSYKDFEDENGRSYNFNYSKRGYIHQVGSFLELDVYPNVDFNDKNTQMETSKKVFTVEFDAKNRFIRHTETKYCLQYVKG